MGEVQAFLMSTAKTTLSRGCIDHTGKAWENLTRLFYENSSRIAASNWAHCRSNWVTVWCGADSISGAVQAAPPGTDPAQPWRVAAAWLGPCWAGAELQPR